MDDSKPFPLFRLPRLAIEEVISTITPFEIINFSMTSLKIKYFIKCFLKNNRNSKYLLQLDTSKEPIVTIRGSEIHFKLITTMDKAKHGEREFENFMGTEKFDKLWIYSENVLDGWMEVVTTVMKIFKLKKHFVIFNIDTFPTKNKAIVDLIKSQTPSIEYCEFNGKTEADEDVEYFLNNLNITGFLVLNLKLSDRFKFPQANHINSCSLDPANWLTFNQLLQFKGSDLYIHDSPFTSYELNQFLILWMTSQCHQNLRFLVVNINDPQSLETIFNLPFEILDPNVERIGRLSNNKTISLKGDIDIKRNDGMTGTINFKWRGDKMLLQMLVSRIE
ncbi:hypothetical protein CRE_11241 [Caenorhabditis remanei]|uniref:F-box domain-containing protein n=1 Tax=Caenorhabditis remanei TaxID=31234 RepID=E3MQ54_CAERE|nr:hypothetical protein CRE_11241 [Caenorhabditis remanei]